MKWYRRQVIFGGIWLMLGMFCWCAALSAWAQMDSMWHASQIHYRDPKGNTSFDDMKSLRRQMALDGIGEVVVWAQTLSEEVALPELNSNLFVDVLWVDGNTANIWKPDMARGNLPVSGDTIGCALDQKTILQLFGSLDVIGKQITLKGQELTLRGIFTLPTGLASFSVDPGRGLAIAPAATAGEHVTVTAMDFTVPHTLDKTAEEQVEAWLHAAAIHMTGTLEDFTDIDTLFSFLSGLPGYVLAAFILLELSISGLSLTKRAYRMSRALLLSRDASRHALYRVLVSFFIGLMILIGIAFFILRQPTVNGSIPPSYLPTRWSDFSFWGKLMTRIAQQTAQRALNGSLRPDMLKQHLTALSFGFLTLSFLFIWNARSSMVRGYVAGKPFTILWPGLMGCICTPFALLLTQQIGFLPVILPGMRLLPAAWMISIPLLASGRVLIQLFHRISQPQSSHRREECAAQPIEHDRITT